MIGNVYTLFDRVAAARTGALVVHSSDAPVIRMFHDALAQDEQLRRHAGDYDMLRVGQILADGELVPETPTVVAQGAQWLAAQSPKLAAEA